MDSGKHVGQLAPKLQKRRLQAAKELLRIMEEGSGRIDDNAGFIDNLSARQEVIGKIRALQERLKEIRQTAASSAALPEEQETEAQADRVLHRICELNQKNIDDVSRHLQIYKSGIARLKTGKSGMAAYLKNSELPGKWHFDARG